MKSMSKQTLGARNLDPYFSRPEVPLSLLALEGDRIPNIIWEPACGDGAIVRILREAGKTVVCSDIQDYGFPGTAKLDFFRASEIPTVPGWTPSYG
jgi:hypothetical protein